MKIHLLSDLHLEFGTPSERFGAVDSDVVVLAGAIHTGAMGIAWAGQIWTYECPGRLLLGTKHYSRNRTCRALCALKKCPKICPQSDRQYAPLSSREINTLFRSRLAS